MESEKYTKIGFVLPVGEEVIGGTEQTNKDPQLRDSTHDKNKQKFIKFYK